MPSLGGILPHPCPSSIRESGSAPDINEPAMTHFTTASLRNAARRIAARTDSAAAELNEQDGKLGDGDLGITVSKGWAEIAAAADAMPDDVGMAFLECSKAFQRVSSSSYGTLTATAFMAVAKACKGRTDVPFADVPALVAAARDAMMARGKGQLGDKTVLDALDAIAAATNNLADPAALLAAADQAMKATLDAFRDKPNLLGRARMFGEKSRGLDDPGMLALRRVIDGLL
jgi:phosphoenolpyruvate---glycerone phosphotransferase subunit DhaL